MAERGQRLHGVLDHDAGGASPLDARPAPGRPGPRRRAASACATKSWPSWLGPAQGDEQLARRDAAGIDRDAGDRPVAARLAAGRGRELGGGPERAAQAVAPRAVRPARRVLRGPPSRRRTAARGRRRSARSRGPCRRPPGGRPPARLGDRGADRARGGRRSRSPPGQAARIARRIAAGSSLRGLSSVTKTRSASAAAISPIIGRLPRIAIAAAAEHHDEAARGVRAQRVAAPASSASGLWA